MNNVTAHGSAKAVDKALVQAGDGLVGHVLIPLVLCAVLALGMSCFLTFEYHDRNEWASKASNFSAYELSVTSAKSSAIAPIPASVAKEAQAGTKVRVSHH